MEYQIKKSFELTESEVTIILNAWSVEEWKNLTFDKFVEQFKDSEFHLLFDESKLVSLCRINFKFHFRIDERTFNIPELVGLVSIVKGSGYGKEMLSKLKENLKSRNLECISFCYAHNRGFYAKCSIEVLEDYAKFFREPAEKKGEWIVSDDDDVLDINLNEDSLKEIKSLSENKFAFLDAKVEELPEACVIPR